MAAGAMGWLWVFLDEQKHKNECAAQTSVSRKVEPIDPDRKPKPKTQTAHPFDPIRGKRFLTQFVPLSEFWAGQLDWVLMVVVVVSAA